MRLRLSQNIFIYDAIGAAITSLLVVFLVGKSPNFFGLEPKVCIILGLIAFGFSIYSLISHFLPRSFAFRFRLGFIAISNFLYCLFTFLIVFGMIEFSSTREVTLWGKLYFIGEIMIVLMLVFVELRMVFRAKNNS